MLIKVISLLFLVQSMHCALPTATDFQPKPCAPDDVKCVSDGFAAFMIQTADGIADLNIKPTDPLILESVTSNVVDGVSIHYKKVNITGFKNEVLTEFKMDTVAKTMAFTAITDFKIVSDVEIEYEETRKTFTGTFTAHGNAVFRVNYDYKLTPDDKGVEHLDSGAWAVTCEFTTLVADVNKELLDSIEKDSHAKKIQDNNIANIETLKKTNVCNIMKAAHVIFHEDNRLVEGVVPAREFFINP